MPAPEAGDVAALVLAAGASSRMPGTPKLLCPWGEGVVIEAVIAAARRSDLAPIHVVVGADATRLMRHLQGSDVIAISHQEWRSGPSSTLSVGLAALRRSERSSAVVILLGDEPGIREDVIRSTVSTWRAGEAELLRARYRDRPGHPVLLARAGWTKAIEAAAVEGDSRSNWERLSSLGLAASEVPVEGPAPVDVDDRSALERARARAVGGDGRHAGPERR
ncbi:MAG: NTP transferase domain-containing protein [Gemmatimonadota bacterium]